MPNIGFGHNFYYWITSFKKKICASIAAWLTFWDWANSVSAAPLIKQTEEVPQSQNHPKSSLITREKKPWDGLTATRTGKPNLNTKSDDTFSQMFKYTI
jgi:hypothetical protein